MTQAETPRLTQTVSCAGCAAKLDPNLLIPTLRGVPWPQSDQVLVGFDDCDDAGVFQCSDGKQLIATTDFFTPIVDDPVVYGAAAAANALSDIYAMGGKPLFALSLVQYPEELGGEILKQILTGAANICKEANCPVIGGHSVKSAEMTFGLAVTGEMEPGKAAIANQGAQVGDAIVLTKALGTGILATGLKKDLINEESRLALEASLCRLNKDAGLLLHEYGAHAATDVTGFSLAGHGSELAKASQVALHIDTAAIPLLPYVADAVAAGCLTRGDKSNRIYAGEHAIVDAGVEQVRNHVVFDPQSSGGLLVALPKDRAADYVAALHAAGDAPAAIIGDVQAGSACIHFH